MNHAAVDPCAVRNRSRAGKKKRCWLSTGVRLVQFDVNDIPAIEEVIAAMRDHHNVDTIVIEDGFIGHFNESVLRLEAGRTYIEVIAKQAGLKVVRVPPATWQTILKGVPRDGIKDKAAWYAEQLPIAEQLPGYPEREDASDAACLHVWYEMAKRRQAVIDKTKGK